MNSRAFVYIAVLVCMLAVGQVAHAQDQPVYQSQWWVPGAPEGLAVGQDGHVWTTNGYEVYAYTTAGEEVDWRHMSNGAYAIATSNWDVYVAGHDHVQTYWSSASTELTTQAFNGPISLAVDYNGNVYVGESSADRIWKFDHHGVFLAYWTAPRPQALTVTDHGWGSLYSLNGSAHQMEEYDPENGQRLDWWPANCEYQATVVGVDVGSNVYMSIDWGDRIAVYSHYGYPITEWGAYGHGDGEFCDAIGAVVDYAGDIYVADRGNQRIQKFRFLDPAGVNDGKSDVALALHATNPASNNQFRVTFTLPSGADARLELFDIAGRRHERRELVSLVPGSQTIELSASEPLPNGLYLVRLTQGNNAKTARVMLIK